MSSYIEEIRLLIPQDQLLRAIWYSDGSGAIDGLGLDSLLPGDFRIKSVEAVGDEILLVLVAKEAPSE